MAATGYTPIQLYYSTTAAAVPTAGNLANGELGINIQDEKLYFKNAAGTVKLLASNATSAPVLTFSAGTTGFTPSTATSGAITLAGTLATTNGGTGLTAFTANQVFYASSTSAFAQSANMTFNGTTLTVNDLTDSSLTSGRVTFAGASGNLTDSANLTYTSGVLTVSNTGGRSVSGTGTSALFASNSAAHSLIIGDNNYAYFQLATAASPTYLAFQYNAVEKMRIEGVNGNIGFGGQAPPPNTVYPGIFLPYQTNMIPIGGSGGLYYNIYGVGTQLKWQVSSLGGSSFTFGPSSFVWSINGTGGTADTNAALTQYMQLTSTGLAVTGAISATGDITAGNSGGNFNVVVGNASANWSSGLTLKGSNTNTNWEIGQNRLASSALTFTPSTAGGGTTFTTPVATLSTTGLAVTGTLSATGQITGRTSNGAVFVSSNGSDADFVLSLASALVTQNVTGSLQLQTGGSNRAVISSTGLAVTGTLSASTSISTGLYSVPSTNVGIARQSATDALEIKGTGAYIARFNNDTSTSLGGTLQISSNGVAYASTSAFMVQGFTYTSDFSIANATAQIIGTRMTNDTWNPTLNIVTVRQSLTTGSLSFGGIGFSTIDASNSAGMRDGARIAIVNESTSAVASPTAMAFYTNVGSATQTFPATERVRIASDGSVFVGATAQGNLSAKFYVNGNVSGAAAFLKNSSGVTGSVALGLWSDSAKDTSSYLIQGINTNQGGNGIVVAIYANGNVQNINNSYGAISDAKLKENIIDATSKLDDLMQVKVRNYNLIGDTTKQIGVVAQELEQVFPAMIDETPDRDAKNNDLGTTTKSVKYSVFVPMLIKAIQEQQAIIESLKARLDAANL
jgi:hypothetical protein